MNNKIVFGIIVPIIIIIALAIVASLNIGFSESENFVKSIFLKDLFQEGYVKNSIKVGDVTLTNEYFLPKRHTLEYAGACLIDKERGKQAIIAGDIQYSEGDYNPNDKYDYMSYNNYGEKSVELKSNSKKIVGIYLYPSYNFQNMNYSELVERYGGYDEIVIFKKNTYNDDYYSYDSCNLNQEELDKAVHIPITVGD